MTIITRIIDNISTTFGIISGLTMIVGVLMVITEVVLRTLFNSTIYITQEYMGYFMVAITLFGLAYTLKEKGHIRLTFLQKLIKSGKGRTILDIITFFLGLIVFLIITYATFNLFLNTYNGGTRSMQISKTYLAIPQFVLPLGSFIMSLQFISEILKSIIKLKTGEYNIDDDKSDALGR